MARKRAVVLRLLQGEPMELLSRELGVPVYKLERWRGKAAGALEGALKEREADTADGELAAALRRIGELSREVEWRAREDGARTRPFGPRASRLVAKPSIDPLDRSMAVEGPEGRR